MGEVTAEREGIMSAVDTEEWFALPSAKVSCHLVNAEIRAWRPGDGMSCRGAQAAKRVPCGPPVAVIRSEKKDTRYAGYEAQSRVRFITSVYCERHTAELVRVQVGDADRLGNSSLQQSVRKAEETVLSAHWDEYQAALAEVIAEQKETYLSKLPDWLRESFDRLATDNPVSSDEVAS